MNLIEEFKWRGLLNDVTEGTEEHLKNKNISAYIGFDPTATSLHVGSLLPIMCLARLQKAGHTPIIVVGGGTGMVGDPSGKSDERQLLTQEKTDYNLKLIKKQLSNFFDFKSKENPAIILNNYDWLSNLSVVDFLRDIGKHFTINYMRAKESVKSREKYGISFTEFSYMILQAYDFYILNKQHNCTLQMGGSDQWGNITAGIDLVGKIGDNKVYGLTFPLITSATGMKFGKTETSAIWLDSSLTSPYKFYQFWLNTKDSNVIQYLKFFTWLTKSEINELEEETNKNPHNRLAQKRLAEEITKIVHGSDQLEKVKNAANVLFGGRIGGLKENDIKDIFSDVPSVDFSRNEILHGNPNIIDILTQTNIISSRNEVKRMIANGGLYINNEKIYDTDTMVISYVIEGSYIVVRKGKKDYTLINLI